MFRSKSPSKDLQNKADNLLAGKDRAVPENREKVPIDVAKVESMCYKKCIYSLNTPALNYAEKNCLDRCAYKFKESIEFGHHLLLYINFKVREANTPLGGL